MARRRFASARRAVRLRRYHRWVADTLTKDQRSLVMSRVRSKDTVPEMRVRRVAHRMGYRYRLHRKHLPGCPDMVFPGRGAIVFVHGCFFHRHQGCALARIPKSRQDFWVPKLTRNAERDAEKVAALKALGWRVLVVWECEVSGRGWEERLRSKLAGFLDGGRA